MTINIHASGMELTPAIRQYVEEKFGMLEKYASNILMIDVDLGMDTHHHQKGDIFFCSAKIDIPNDMLTVEKTEEDLYKAIDKVKDHLQESLIERKERARDLRRKGGEDSNVEEPIV
ncbi:ribosome-associated translation inhibitor RaiA [Patescibacteria group bacterium]|nr:ribosome-associated translation inhibitor RaiA [Patescibacteria group bacterium]